MRKRQTIPFLFLVSMLLIQIQTSFANIENIELLSKGSANVEGIIEYSTTNRATRNITDSKKYNCTYRIDDVWTFDDIEEKVVQFTQKRYIIEYNGESTISETAMQITSLIWQKNASWLITHAEDFYTRIDGTASFKISLLHIRTYSDIIDPYNAQITFHNGTTAIIRDIYETMENLDERHIIYNYVTGDYKNPLGPTCFYILSPNVELNQEIRFLGNVTDFVEINVGDKTIQTIKVEENKFEYFSDTNYNIYNYTYYFEQKTGLLIKYKRNYTNYYATDLVEFNPIVLEIPYKTFSIDFSTISIIFVLVIITFLRNEKKRKDSNFS